jgi:hypothetical protein
MYIGDGNRSAGNAKGVQAWRETILTAISPMWAPGYPGHVRGCAVSVTPRAGEPYKVKRFGPPRGRCPTYGRDAGVEAESFALQRLPGAGLNRRISLLRGKHRVGSYAVIRFWRMSIYWPRTLVFTLKFWIPP